MSDSKFSYFKNPITNLIPANDTTLEAVYQLIISDKFKDETNQLRSIDEIQAAKTFKAANFNYVTFNGVFTSRADKDLKTPSNYFIIDIDHLGKSLLEVRQRIISDKILCPQLVFISPSGDGLKIVVRMAPDIINYAAAAKIMDPIWQGVNSYFVKEYSDILTPNAKGEIIDGACKDLSRACFLCKDVTAYLNENEKILGCEFI